MSIVTALATHVPAPIRERGREYFRSGIVTLDSVRPVEVLATVHGSEDYDVDLSLEGRTVHATCTCPYVAENLSACKHIWATVLAAEPVGFARAAAAVGLLRLAIDDVYEDNGYDDAYRDEFRSFPRQLPPLPPIRRENWKDQLAALSREVQPTSHGTRPHNRTAERQLLYVIDGPESERARKLFLEINHQERKMNGEWSKPKAQHVSTTDLDAWTDPFDKQLLAILGGAERGES